MRKLLWFVAGFAAGVAVLIYFLDGKFWPAAAVCAPLAVVLFCFKAKPVRRFAIIFLGLALGTAWCSGYTAVVLRSISHLEGQTVTFRARASDYSAETRFGFHVTADLLTDGRSIPTNFYFTEDISLRPGDVFTGTAEFHRASMSVRAGEDLYDISRGIHLTANAEKLKKLPSTERTAADVLLRFSNSLKENLYAVFPSDSAGYFTALTNGDRSGMTYAFRNRLAVVGLYHAVSLSGMHVSILMSALLFLCFRRKRLAAIIGIPAICLFAVMSGASPATMRAVVMQTVLLVCCFVDREYDSPTALSATLLLLLLENPWCLTHWGLQLSFASTAGLLTLMPRFSRLPIKFKWLRRLLTPTFVTLSATVFSAPLMSLYFGMNSLMAPLTNLLALWSVTVSFIAGIAISLLAFLSVPVARYLALAADLLYRWLELVTNIFADLPFATVYWDTPLLLIWSYLAYLLLIAAILLRPRWWVAAAGAAAMLLTALLPVSPKPDGLTVLDVGQGQCLLLRAGDDTVLVDCGGNGDETGKAAARYLLSHGVYALDAVVITHFDADHCDGILQLADAVPADAYYVQDWADASPLQRELCARLLVTVVKSPVTLPLEEMSVTLYTVGGKSENNAGVCVLASCRECDILITGDLSIGAEARLVTQYDLPDLEVLVAGHHGSDTSTGFALLDALRPETVLVSVGENPFGFPAAETLDRITASGAVCYTTQENGNLTIGW